MAYCRKCGNKLDDQSRRCSECGEMYKDEYNYSEDTPSILHLLVGLFLPVIGFILYLVWKKDRPKSARKALIGVLIAIPLLIVSAIPYVLMIQENFTPIIENTRKSAAYADALFVEQNVDLYCEDYLCGNDDEFTYGMIESYLDVGYLEDYEISQDTVIAYMSSEGIHVQLEAVGTGEWEFVQGEIPSQTTRDESVIRDIN